MKAIPTLLKKEYKSEIVLSVHCLFHSSDEINDYVIKYTNIKRGRTQKASVNTQFHLSPLVPIFVVVKVQLV